MNHCASAIALLVIGSSAVPAAGETLTGTIQPLNEERVGQSASGTIELTRDNGDLTLLLKAEGLSPGMHLAHLHGFEGEDPAEARCPGAEADVNDDGYIDLIETREVSGVTMVPLTDDPVSLEIQSQSYPDAGAAGDAEYRQSVDPAALAEALQERFGTPAALDRRVLYIHGVGEETELPESVQSLDGVPASVTLPIACAEFAPTQP